MKTFAFFLAALAVASAIPARQLRDVKVLHPQLTVRPGVDLNKRFDSRIWGGVPADISEFPFAVSIVIDDAFFCTGSIISENYVITAGHCMDGARTAEVTYGVSDFNDPAAGVANSARCVAHENYSGGQVFENDIGFIEVEGSISFAGAAAPAVIADAEPAVGDFFTAAGWGKTGNFGGVSNQLNKAEDLEVVTDQEADIYSNDINFDHFVCSYEPNDAPGDNEGGTCGGDSGGPAIDASGNIFGATSFGSQFCTTGPSCFTSLPVFRDWIRQNTGV